MALHRPAVVRRVSGGVPHRFAGAGVLNVFMPLRTFQIMLFQQESLEFPNGTQE
jgi:hypothetical protein